MNEDKTYERVRVCHCEQCRGSKRRLKNKRWYKRMTNKLRRKGKAYTLMYA